MRSLQLSFILAGYNQTRKPAFNSSIYFVCIPVTLCGKKQRQASVGSRQISHLQYADSMILFALSSEEQLYMIRLMIELHKEVSGLKVNFNKSQVVGINVDEMPLRRASYITGCSPWSFPVTYLGMPLSPGSPQSRLAVS